jgi:hypothetical protein
VWGPKRKSPLCEREPERGLLALRRRDAQRDHDFLKATIDASEAAAPSIERARSCNTISPSYLNTHSGPTPWYVYTGEVTARQQGRDHQRTH